MIKKGLKVKILTGKDKKKEGEVIEIDRPNNRAKVKEINMVKKHVKTTKEKKGGIISKESLGLKNIFMTPKVEKVVLNMGLGLDGADAKVLKACEEDMSKITGQKPVITKFKKSVANFKTRKGTNAGLKVTLRENKMYEFLDRLVNIALPRICLLYTSPSPRDRH